MRGRIAGSWASTAAGILAVASLPLTPAAASTAGGLCELPAELTQFEAAEDCRLERGDFAESPDATAEPAEISVVAHNVEQGRSYDRILSFYLTDPRFSNPDILLLSEVDRDCRRSGNRNVARELASRLKMNFVYGVELIVLPESPEGAPCEHGNAILSRFPIRQAERIQHRLSDRRFETAENGRPATLGGRMFLGADLDIPGEPLRVYALHFSSGAEDNRRRADQAREVTAHADDWPGPVVAGGDINSGFYLVDLLGNTSLDKTPPVFRAGGFIDAHRRLPMAKRPTAGPYRGARLLLDVIFVRGLEVASSLVCSPEACRGLSDHLPILTRLRWPPKTPRPR